MSVVSRTSIFSAAVNALQTLLTRGPSAETISASDDMQYRVSILRVREGRIIEQSARLNGC